MGNQQSQSAPTGVGQKKQGDKSMKAWLVDKSLGTAANLSKLLPTGTTLAFQTMAPAFTKGGECEDHDVNFWFTWGLVAFLAVLCAVLSFTDSVTDREGETYYGLATPNGLYLFNHTLSELDLFDEGEDKAERLRKLEQSMKIRPRDFMHAIVSPAVFLSLALCDAGVQRCIVPKESKDWQGFLADLPLAMGFLAGFLFMVFPSTRNGIGDDGPAGPPAEVDTKATTTAAGDAGKTHKFDSSLMTMDTTRVAPPSSYEIDDHVV